MISSPMSTALVGAMTTALEAKLPRRGPSSDRAGVRFRELPRRALDGDEELVQAAPARGSSIHSALTPRLEPRRSPVFHRHLTKLI